MDKQRISPLQCLNTILASLTVSWCGALKIAENRIDIAIVVDSPPGEMRPSTPAESPALKKKPKHALEEPEL